MQSLYKQLLPLTLIREICYLGSDHTFNFFYYENKFNFTYFCDVPYRIPFILFLRHGISEFEGEKNREVRLS